MLSTWQPDVLISWTLCPSCSFADRLPGALEPACFAAADATTGSDQQDQPSRHNQQKPEGKGGNGDGKMDIVAPTGTAMFDASDRGFSCPAGGVQDLNGIGHGVNGCEKHSSR